MTAMVSVVSGGSVVHAQQFSGMKNGKGARIAAIKGARYVLAEMHGGVAAGDISVKRVGKNLVIEQQKAGAESASVVIEDFYGNEGQLVGLGADGEYLEYLAAGEPGATEAWAITDGASAQLTLAAGQPAFSPSSFALAEGGSSVFSSALSGVAALAAGAALSNNSSGGSKAQPAPAASAFVLEDQRVDADAGQPASASVKPDVSAAVQDAGNTAGPVAEVHTEADDVSADDAAINDLSSDANTNENAAINDRASNAITNENAAPAESNTAPEAEAITSPGLVGAPSAVVPFAVDDIPVIEKVMDDHGVIQGVIENGGYTDDVYPTLMGHADPGVKVHVYRGKYLQGYTVADENGVWSYTPSSAYASGTHSMTVKYEYPNKDTSGYSEPYVITIDKIAPGIPKITGILDDEGRITGAITDQTVTDDNRPTITGTAEANAKLIVYDKGKQIGSTTVGADGTWSFTPDTPLADGLHMLSYSAVDRAGNSGEQTDVTEFFVDTRPEKVSIYYAEDDAGSVTGDVYNGGVTDDSTPTLFGTATAGGIVKIYEGGVLLGHVTADVDGTWQFTPSVLSDGVHTFHATVTLVAKGESERSKPFVLNVAASPMEKPSINQILDDVGAVQGAVGNGKSTDDNTPTLVGKAQAGSTVHVYEGGALLGSVQADAGGNWRFPVTVPLVDGAHVFTAKTESKAGNLSEISNAYAINVDTVAPAQIATFTSMGKDSGFDGGDWLTNDGSAGRLLQGTLNAALAANESLLVSTDNGITWVVANVAGMRWVAQDEGVHASSWTIRTRVVDTAGNIGPVSERAVVLDTAAPKAPLSVSIESKTMTVKFDGTKMVAGDHVNIISGGQSMDYKLTAADIAAGKVTCVPTITIGADVRVAMVDRAGNVSDYREADSKVQEIWNFDGYSVGTYLAAGAPVSGSLGGSLRFQAYGSGMDASRGMVHNFSGMTKGLWIGANSAWRDNTGYDSTMTSGVFKIDKAADAISFKLVTGNNPGNSIQTVTVVFYDSAGLEVGRTSTAGYIAVTSVSYVAPAGRQISSFTCFFPNDRQGVVFDDFVITRNKTGELVPVEAVQSIASDAVGVFHGGIEDNLYTLADVRALEKTWIEGNGGIDTLKLLGSAQTLNLSTLVGKVSSVEVFDITGTGNNTLKLSLADVLENGARDLFAGDGHVQLMVKGNAGDRVELSDLLGQAGQDVGDWSVHGQVRSLGVTYNVYQHSGMAAELLVQSGVDVNLSNHS